MIETFRNIIDFKIISIVEMFEAPSTKIGNETM